jgi:hypothetical protein
MSCKECCAVWQPDKMKTAFAAVQYFQYYFDLTRAVVMLSFVMFVCDFCFVSSISGIGIQCCKRQEVKESLANREKIRVDPYSSE